jgi:predicted nucleotidyltransferase
MDSSLASLLSELCRRYHVRKLALYGSTLRGEDGPESDIDLIVEFLPGKTPGLLTIARMERELSAIYGKKVDLRTPQELSRYFRDEVMNNNRIQYAHA